nr:hypothetical protein [Chthoniobacterales bacterium]
MIQHRSIARHIFLTFRRLQALAIIVIAAAALPGAEDPLRAQFATQPAWPANTIIKVANYGDLERALAQAHEDT